MKQHSPETDSQKKLVRRSVELEDLPEDALHCVLGSPSGRSSAVGAARREGKGRCLDDSGILELSSSTTFLVDHLSIDAVKMISRIKAADSGDDDSMSPSQDISPITHSDVSPTSPIIFDKASGDEDLSPKDMMNQASSGSRGPSPMISPRGKEQLRPRNPGDTSTRNVGAELTHPQRWSEEQVRAWFERRTKKKKVGALSKGTDGKNIMRWPRARFEQLCGGDKALATALYHDLRAEIERYERWRRGDAKAVEELESFMPPVKRVSNSDRPSTSMAKSTCPPPPPGAPTPSEVVTVGQVLNPSLKESGATRSKESVKRVSERATCATELEPPKPSIRESLSRDSSAQSTPGSTSTACPSSISQVSVPSSGSHAEANPRASGMSRIPIPSVAAKSAAARPRNADSSKARAPSTGASPRTPASSTGRQQSSASRQQDVSKHSYSFTPAVRPSQRGLMVAGKAEPYKAAAVGTPMTGSSPAKSSFATSIAAKAKPPRASQPASTLSKELPAPVPSKAKNDSDARKAKAPSSKAIGAAPSLVVDETEDPELYAHLSPNSRAALATLSPNSRAALADPARRGKTMEDLGDDTLKQVSSPKRSEQQAGINKEMFHNKADMTSRKSRDDLEIAPRKNQQRQNSSAVPEDDGEETRQMFDKRLLRRKHRLVYEKWLDGWKAQHPTPVAQSPPGLDEKSVRVCVRKRPLFAHESENQEFDVVTVRGPEVVVHNCLTKANLRSLFVSHMGFHFARAFAEDCNDDEVYAQCGDPAVAHALGGGTATLFMFGQTGSGKTHTMQALLQRAAMQLFKEGPGKLHLAAFEIAGKSMADLLDPGEKKELKIMEDKDRRTRVVGVKWCAARSGDELLQLCREAQQRRTTRATQVNDVSSRSHSILRVGRKEEEPILTLVDCAGSERREDSSHHDAQSRKDAAEINSTIFALKECFRVMRSCKGQQPPYRESLLTRVLSDSFTNDHARVIAIGTVSPSGTDTEHSIATLRSLQMLQGTQMTFERREDIKEDPVDHIPVHPRAWSEEDVRKWLETVCNCRAKAHVSAISKGTDGKNMVRWPIGRFVQLCGGDEALGSALFRALREEVSTYDARRNQALGKA